MTVIEKFTSFDRKNYFAHQYQNIEALATNRLGYYFCEGEQLTSTNLKLGTFNKAMRNCKELMARLFVLTMSLVFY